eukprot:RCo043065
MAWRSRLGLQSRLGRLGVSSAAALGCVALVDYLLDQSLSRNARAVALAAQITLAYKFCEDTPAALQEVHRQTATNLLHVCQSNGGLYIKLGQGIASMNHILPEVYTEILSVLQDKAKAVPFSDVEKIFFRDFGVHPDRLFAEFERTPVASASIAQVHVARLKDGTKVAVKVIKPHVIRQTPWDILCYKFLVLFFEKVFDLPMYWTTDYTTKHLRMELDFENEARNATRCAAGVALRSDVVVPAVVWPLSRKGVMTTEWVDGVKITDAKAIQAMGLDVKAVTKTMVEVFADQIFSTGFVHCDPHPGNLLVRPMPMSGSVSAFWEKCWGRPAIRHQLCILDHGLYITEPPKFRQQYCEFWRALFLRDFERLGLICAEWGVRDVDFFASLQLFRPFNRETRRSASSSVTRAEARDFQRQAKERVRGLLTSTSLVPLELIFVGRSMNLIRFNNKVLGSPVNRLALFASSAAKGAATRLPGATQAFFQLQLALLSLSFILWQLWLDCKTAMGYQPRTIEDALEDMEKQTLQDKLGFAVREKNLG